MFRIAVGPQPDKMTFQQAQNAVQDWLDSNAEWTEDPDDHQLVETNTESDDSSVTYWVANTRFRLDDAKDNLVQKFGDKFEQKCRWYRMGYHECDHDETEDLGCAWSDVIEWTAKDETIPTDVPDFGGV